MTKQTKSLDRVIIRFAGDSETIGRLPWAILSVVNVPALGELIGSNLYGPEAFLTGILAGLAAQTTLGNMFAGLQLAFTDAVRIDDVVVVEGTDLTGQDSAVEFSLNARLANDLGCPMIAVVSGRDRTPDEVADAVDVALDDVTAQAVGQAQGIPLRQTLA